MDGSSPRSHATIIEQIGRFVAETPVAIDAKSRAVVRSALIDLVGCIVIGSREEVAVKARSAMGQRLGQVTVFGTSEAFSPEAAAFVNAVAGHALDFDDWELPGNTHPSVTIIPALLAAADGHPLSGQAFTEAYVVGFEIIARLGEGLNFEHYDAGWHSTATFGPIGAAAAVARLWRLDAHSATNAVAIAVSQASGLTAQFGSDAKPLQAGFASAAGLTAASLAAAGLSGQPHVLQGPTGYIALTAHGDEERLAAAFAGIGRPFSIESHGLVFKPYPSCGYTHRIVDAALELYERGLDLLTIADIELALPNFHADVLPFRAPTTSREARFSLPFCAALALSRGAMAVQDFVDEAWHDPLIARLIERTRVAPFEPLDPSLNYDPRQPDRILVTLSDGTVLEAAVDYPLGSPQRPMSFQQITAKFHSVTGASDHEIAALSNWMNADNIFDLLKPWNGPQ